MELLPPIKYIFEFLAYGCSFFSIRVAFVYPIIQLIA